MATTSRRPPNSPILAPSPIHARTVENKRQVSVQKCTLQNVRASHPLSRASTDAIEASINRASSSSSARRRVLLLRVIHARALARRRVHASPALTAFIHASSSNEFTEVFITVRRVSRRHVFQIARKRRGMMLGFPEEQSREKPARVRRFLIVRRHIESYVFMCACWRRVLASRAVASASVSAGFESFIHAREFGWCLLLVGEIFHGSGAPRARGALDALVRAIVMDRSVGHDGARNWSSSASMSTRSSARSLALHRRAAETWWTSAVLCALENSGCTAIHRRASDSGT